MSNGPGSTSTPTTLYCPTCGAATPVDAQVCARCGTTLPGPSSGLIPPMEPQYPVVQGQSPYAGFWMRLVALIIDRLLVGVVLMPFYLAIALSVMAAGTAVRMPDLGQRIVVMIGAGVLGIVAQWLYFAVMESSQRQATFGKQLLGLKVTDLAGQRITFARATGRFFAKIISAMTLLIGYIMAGVTEKKQALHDMIAGTLVVRK